MRSAFRCFVLMVSVTGLLGMGCGSSSEDTPSDEETTTEDDSTNETSAGEFTLSSSAFGEGDTLPTDHVCDRDGGAELSPPIAWADAPEGTQSFAVGMFHYPNGAVEGVDDPSHYWLVWNIPATTAELASGNTEGVGTEGSNKDGVEIGYTAPCSPGDAVHEYTIRVYALSEAPTELGEADDLSVGWAEFEAAVAPKALATDEMSFLN